MMKNKNLKIFLIAVAIPIVYSIFNFFNILKPSYTQTYNPKEELVVEKRFYKSGCYELGFWSSGKDLHYHRHDGKFIISLYHNDEFLEKRVITKEEQSGYTMKGGYGSSIALDTIKIPYKGKYSKLKIVFKTEKEDSVVSKNDSIKFYINESILSCGKEKDYYRNNRKFPITKKETNETLKPLYLALVKKDTEKVKEIIEGGISPEVVMVGKRNPLHYSAFKNDTKTIKYLLDKKVDINKKDVLEYTPLHYAIENNATKAVEMLLENGADLKLVETVTTRYIHQKFFRTHPNVPMPRSLTYFIQKDNLVELGDILYKNGLEISCDNIKHLKLIMRNYDSDYNFYKRNKIIYENIDKNNSKIMELLKTNNVFISMDKLKNAKEYIQEYKSKAVPEFTDKDYTKLISILEKYGKEKCRKEELNKGKK